VIGSVASAGFLHYNRMKRWIKIQEMLAVFVAWEKTYEIDNVGNGTCAGDEVLQYLLRDFG
jgi:hypothetical protein